MRKLLTLIAFIAVAKVSANEVQESKKPLRVFDYSNDAIVHSTIELMREYKSVWRKSFLDANIPSRLYLTDKLEREVMYGRSQKR